MITRMKISIVSLIGLILFAVAPNGGLLYSQQDGSSPIPLADLASPDLQKRMDAYESIRTHPVLLQRVDVRQALLNLLNRETQVIQKASRDLGEGYAEYVAELLGTIAETADWSDQRQLCILAESPYNSDSKFAEMLATKGGAAVAPCLLKMAQRKSENSRYESIPVLVQLVAITSGLSPKIRYQSQQAIISGLHDSSSGVRLATVQAAGKFGTAEMIPHLQMIARSDPVSRVLDNGQRRFDIRDAAVKAIESIENRTKSK
jgi:hypothetical protein